MTEKCVRSNLKREELLSAPERKWDEVSTYKSIFIVPSKKKHDSGWHVMVIVGVKDDGSFEQAAWCDDICWDVQGVSKYRMRNDCTYPSGIVHFWGSLFTVGASLSSTDVTVREIPRA